MAKITDQKCDESVAVLACRKLTKQFRQGDHLLTVLEKIDFTVQRGQRVGLVGSSGAGKSTLLHLLGGLDTPSAGEVWVEGEPISQLSDAARGRLRNQKMGFIYQFHHLLPEFTALENIAMPLLIRGLAPSQAREVAYQWLERVGLSARARHKPGELSGGERQRAAVARALITQPACVLADEPTGNLDRANAEQVFDLLVDLNETHQTSLVIVTHALELANRMESCWRLADGHLYQER